jgi:hypothetical protein
MTRWQEIIASALVGAERKPWNPSAGDDALSAILARLSGEPAEIMLKAAALISIHDRAGRLPRACERVLPAPCPADSRPGCGPRAAFHLRSMLAGNFNAVLPEWLGAVVKAGQRVPEELVPGLLKSANRQPRDLVMAAAGSLATWLDMPVHEWRPYVDAASVDWETATNPERMALLEILRKSDPAAAIELIQSTWKADKADQRKDFLRTLEQGLSPADESFLEAALDDKSIVVRRAAAGLLARIEGSALRQRMTDAVRGCVKAIAKGMLLNRRKAIEVAPLTELPPALARDGVEAKGAPQGIGERAWWTMQTIGLVPPSLWTESFAMAPDQLMEAASQGDDLTLLTMAWTVAALRHKSSDWARALLLCEAAPVTQTNELFELLPPSTKEEVVLSDKKDRTSLFLGLCRHPWSAGFTREIMKRVSAWPPNTLRELARFADIDFQDEIAPEFDAVLRFRRDMLQAIANRG